MFTNTVNGPCGQLGCSRSFDDSSILYLLKLTSLRQNSFKTHPGRID